MYGSDALNNQLHFCSFPSLWKVLMGKKLFLMALMVFYFLLGNWITKLILQSLKYISLYVIDMRVSFVVYSSIALWCREDPHLCPPPRCGWWRNRSLATWSPARRAPCPAGWLDSAGHRSWLWASPHCITALENWCEEKLDRKWQRFIQSSCLWTS